MKGVLNRIKALGFSVQLTEEVKEFIAEKGYDVQFGARPLHRAIQKYLEDPLAEEILNMKIKEGDVLQAELNKETDQIKFSIYKEPKESKRSKA
jgi:ATP-dependent Clp protease ATP-binding subunit ClpC